MRLLSGLQERVFDHLLNGDGFGAFTEQYSVDYGKNMAEEQIEGAL